MKISICIPTYNRATHLANCLNSLKVSAGSAVDDFEVCISDNASTDDTQEVVRQAQAVLPIRYRRNAENLGISRNFLNVVEMAEGEFVWLVGDDDLIVPSGLARLSRLIDEHPRVDFYYVNAFHLTTEHVLSCQQPFDTRDLPRHLRRFSNWQIGGELPFLSLISPKVSFDFLGGMFLSVFRRKNWIENSGALDSSAITDSRTFSHFDNTFPHIRIFSRAFARSQAYFNADPLIVCLTGAREWAPKYPLVRSVRLIEALQAYRSAGLPLLTYLHCRNFALAHFLPDVLRMLLRRSESGVECISLPRVILGNMMYPNFYLSPIIDKWRRVQSHRAKVDYATHRGD
jgi:glycosyltransferase involved in cell wall biosynthesis